MARDSFIFYKSFMDAVETIPQIKYRYLLLESIIKVGLFSEESYEKLETFCIETEQKLSKNSQVLGMFLAIKPQIIANYKKFLNGCKGKQYGNLGSSYGQFGGRPKKPPKNPPNENVLNENVLNENVLNVLNESGSSKQKSIDPFINSSKSYFQEEYKKVFGAYPNLLYSECNKICELQAEVENFKQTVPTVFERLKDIKWEFKDGTKKPDIHWLLKENNYVKVLDGAFEVKDEWQEFLEEQRRLEEERINNNANTE